MTLAPFQACEVSPRRNSGKKKALNEALDVACQQPAAALSAISSSLIHTKL